MKRVTLILVIAICLLLSMSGCYELIATADKDAITTGMSELMIRVDEFQEVFKEAAVADLINAKETKKRNNQIDEIQEIVVAANQAIKEAPTLIEGVIAANQTTAPVNPYAGVIDVVLKIIAGTGVLGIAGLGVKVVKDVKTRKELVGDKIIVENKYKATNRANEKLRIAHPEIAEEHWNLVGAEKSSRFVAFTDFLKPKKT